MTVTSVAPIRESDSYFERSNISFYENKLDAVELNSSCGYTYDLLLALATRHSQSCSATEVEGVCKCSQVFPTSATCCKKINSMNILQHCPSVFVTETLLATRAAFWFHNPCNIRKTCVVASAGKNVPRVAAELTRTEKHLWSGFKLSWRCY